MGGTRGAGKTPNAGRISEPRPEGISVMSVGNAKRALAIEHGLESGDIRKGGRPGAIIPPEFVWYNAYPGSTVPLSASALEGPDIWMEPKMSRGNLFISDRLAKLLRDAKMAKGWGLKQYPIVDC